VNEKVAVLLRVLHDAENDVAADLLRIGERHKAEHEVYYLTRDLAAWSREHVRLIAEEGERLGVRLDANGAEPGPLSVVREKVAQLTGHQPLPGLLLLRDLRRIHLDCVGLSVDWELLAQTAQALKDDEMLGLAQRCHPDTLRQARWANSMIKVISPQVMTS
jgi:hypothetical protein